MTQKQWQIAATDPSLKGLVDCLPRIAFKGQMRADQPPTSSVAPSTFLRPVEPGNYKDGHSATED